MNAKGTSLIELMIVVAIMTTLLLSARVAMNEWEYYQDAQKAKSIATAINSGMKDISALKNAGCSNIVAISHADLISAKVPSYLVYPAPWSTTFNYIGRGGIPTENLVGVDTKSRNIAENIFSYSNGDYISGSVIFYRFPLNGVSSDFGSMYKGSSGCWEYGVGSK
ncbi:Tfp pilus assembly protein FimT/FimU [Aeromonas veronii]